MKTTTLKQTKVLVTGKNGQLGHALEQVAAQFPAFNCQFVSRESFDLGQPEQIASFLEANAFDVIINAAAYTAVDKSETETEVCDQVNHLAVKQLAEVAAAQGTKLVHVSTDYVYAGESHRPYIESDPTDPQGTYGATKLAGETAMLEAMPQNGVILRTSWVYSEFGNNFVKTMLRLGSTRDQLNVVWDQIGTPTYAVDLAQAIFQIISHESFQDQDFDSAVYHYSNEGVCSWYDFAKEIFELSGTPCAVSPIEGKDYPTPAKRPHYSVLNKQKIKDQFKLSIGHWKDSLRLCLTALSKEKP